MSTDATLAALVRPGVLILVVRIVRFVFALPLVASLYLTTWIYADLYTGETIAASTFVLGSAVFLWCAGSIAFGIAGHRREEWSLWTVFSALNPVAQLFVLPVLPFLVFYVMKGGLIP